MSENNFKDIYEMYNKFGLAKNTELDLTPKHIPATVSAFRVRALQEEILELSRAYSNQDLPEIADALVDIVVFALGTAVLHNLPWNEIWNEVLRSNMDKQVGRGTKIRNDTLKIDLVKPAGWKGPDLVSILKRYNFEA